MRRGVRRLVSPSGEPRAAGESAAWSAEQSTQIRLDQVPGYVAVIGAADSCVPHHPESETGPRPDVLDIPLIEMHLRRG